MTAIGPRSLCTGDFQLDLSARLNSLWEHAVERYDLRWVQCSDSMTDGRKIIDHVNLHNLENFLNRRTINTPPQISHLVRSFLEIVLEKRVKNTSQQSFFTGPATAKHEESMDAMPVSCSPASTKSDHKQISP